MFNGISNLKCWKLLQWNVDTGSWDRDQLQTAEMKFLTSLSDKNRSKHVTKELAVKYTEINGSYIRD
jgi:hypothetical protein